MQDRISKYIDRDNNKGLSTLSVMILLWRTILPQKQNKVLLKSYVPGTVNKLNKDKTTSPILLTISNSDQTFTLTYADKLF